MSNENKTYGRLTFGEWVLFVGGLISVGSSHARVNFNSDKIDSNKISINENKAFGIARDKKHVDTREYARDHITRKATELNKGIEKNDDSIHVIREKMVEAKVERSHLEKNQERMITILEKLINKTGK